MDSLIQRAVDLTGIDVEDQYARLRDEGMALAGAAGAVLFRGLRLDTDSALCACAETLLGEARPYEGGLGYKRSVDGRVFTSTEQPGFVELTPHSELSYTPNPPRWIAFFCRTVAKKGGATTLVDADAVVRALPDSIVRDFQELGVCYHRTYPCERPWMTVMNRRVRVLVSWQQAFDTSDPEKVAQICTRLGIEYRWDDRGTLYTQNRLPGITQHPIRGVPTWTNQAHTFIATPSNVGWGLWAAISLVYLFPEFRQTHATFGDDSPIPRHYIDTITRTLRSLQRPLSWQRGDVILLDNLAVLHGRMPYRGKREIFTAIA